MPQRHRDQLLTIKELLIVVGALIIVTAVILFVTLSFGGDTPQEKTARRVASLVELASQQASASNQTYALEIQPHGYAFYQYDGSQWQPTPATSIFANHALTNDITLHLTLLEATPLALPQPQTVPSPTSTTAVTPAVTPSQAPASAPQILILPNGKVTPFKLDVASASGNDTYHVRSTLDGKIQIIPPSSKLLKYVSK